MPRRHALPEPEDVLSGRVKPPIADLLDLIHRVNPTGRELGAREADLRYAQKSRLQSLLVRRFAAEIEVVPDTERADTVLLCHRGHGRDGCHAVIAALDEDARAWVQREVDLGPPSSAASPAAPAARPSGRGLPAAPGEEGSPPSGDATPDSLVRRADEAVESYDYERARRNLALAVTASGGAAGPAAALLALVVETLGDDAAALALQPSLSPGARADPEVRGLLALAASRAGDEEGAIALLRGAAKRLAPGVLAALARGALARGDTEGAAAHLEQLRRHDPAHPAVVGLTEDLGRARAAARWPLEAELQALAAAGNDDAAEKKAAEIHARWPESEVARRVLRAAEERRRRGDVWRWVGEAEAALAAGDVDGALARLARAAALAPAQDREAIARRVREAEVAARAKRGAERADRVRRLLLAPDPVEGLLAYLDLGEALRAGLREASASELLPWLELAARGAPRGRVEAVLALARARDRVETDPEGARALLAPHLAVLDRVPEARRLTRAVEARLAERRAAHAAAVVQAARAAFARGAAEEALGHLDEATLRDLRDLPEAERAAADAFRAEVTRVAAHARRVAEVSRLRDGGHLLDARDLAGELAAEAEGEERARWGAERRGLQEAVQRAFHVEVDHEGEPLAFDAGPFPRWNFWSPLRWLTEDATSFVLVEGVGRRVLVHVVDRARLVVTTAVMLKTPEPFDSPWVDVVGRTLWLVGKRGALLVLSMETWDVLRFRAAPEALAGREIEVVPALPVGGAGPRFLWALPDGDKILRVLDVVERRPVREVPTARRPVAVPGSPDPRVVCVTNDALVTFEERGTPVPHGRIEVPGAQPLAAAPHPSGQGLVALVKTEPGGHLAWVDLPPEGPPGKPQVIEGANPDEAKALLACSRDEGMLLVGFVNTDRQSELMALGLAGEAQRALTPLWRLANRTQRMVFIQDAGARRLVGVEARAGGPLVLALGRELPDLPAWEFEGHKLVWLALHQMCMRNNPSVVAAKKMPRDPALAMGTVRGLLRVESTPLTLALAALAFEGGAEELRLLNWLVQNHPDDPEVRLLYAENRAAFDAWDEVITLLAPLVDAPAPASQIAPWHAHHLTAIACLHRGDLDRARQVLAQARPEESACPIVAMQQLLTPLPDPPPPETWGPAEPLIVQFVGAARHADACLARGDHGAALAALGRDPLSTCGEVQILARLAAAWLPTPAPCRRARFRKATALSRFVAAHAEKHPGLRRELPVPGATWDDARLDEVSAEASKWLDAEV